MRDAWRSFKSVERVYSPLQRMNSISHWVQIHPITFAVLLFVASALISLFSQEIKDFLRTWPKTKMAALALKDLRNQLAVLNNLHNDSYQLTLWFVWGLVSVVITSLWANLIVVALFFIMDYPRFPTTVSLGSTFSGVVIGQAFKMRQTMNQLYNYDRSVEDLKKRIATLGG
jgi:hypothetical protein